MHVCFTIFTGMDIKKNIQNYVKIGSTVRPVGSLNEVSDRLEPHVYTISIKPMEGTILTIVDNIDLNIPDRIYGSIPSNVTKSFKAFDRRPLNTGILLSGERGMGKSLFIKMAMKEALGMGMPVFNLTRTEKLAETIAFINSVTQPVLVVMDEFEKNFVFDDKDPVEDTQIPFLSMLDGLGSGEKRMFIASVNAKNKVSTFMLNRPGRFYYHFEFKQLSDSEMIDYLSHETKLDMDRIKFAVSMLVNYSVNYDGLSAIAAELNDGNTIEETLRDLNLDREGSSVLEMYVDVNGYEYVGTAFCSMDELRNRTSIGVDFRSRIPLMETKDLKTSAAGFIGDFIIINFSKVEMKVDKDGRVMLPIDCISNISLDDAVYAPELCSEEDEHGKVWTLYPHQLKSISPVIIKPKRYNHRPVYLDV